MNLDDVRRIKIPRQKKHRVGRGSGSGWGVTSGRGNKGAGSRSGARFRLRFEGGQMPIYRRLPKKGFNNGRFQVEFHAVNVGQLGRTFEAGAQIDIAALKKAGLGPTRRRTPTSAPILRASIISRSLISTRRRNISPCRKNRKISGQSSPPGMRRS